MHRIPARGEYSFLPAGRALSGCLADPPCERGLQGYLARQKQPPPGITIGPWAELCSRFEGRCVFLFVRCPCTTLEKEEGKDQVKGRRGRGKGEEEEEKEGKEEEGRGGEGGGREEEEEEKEGKEEEEGGGGGRRGGRGRKIWKRIRLQRGWRRRKGRERDF